VVYACIRHGVLSVACVSICLVRTQIYPVPCAAALLAQIMNLTPEQIELLPGQQKAQVIALQAQMVRFHAVIYRNET
jgi:Transcription termination and cleavage factor C-terminal